MADKRADVWAFGVVVFEMLTGRRAFEGADVSEVMAGVIKSEPEWDLLPSDLPPALVTYLRRCLQKDPRERLRDIGDVRLAMAGAFDMPPTLSVEQPGTTVAGPQRRIWQQPLPLALTGLALLVVGGLSVWGVVRPAPLLETVTRFSVVLPESDVINLGDGIALSPDGSTLVYAATRDGVQQLFVRARNQMTARPLPGTEDALFPFFSPDGAWVGFFTPESLKKIALAGGPPVTLCPIEGRRGATWGPDDTIVFAAGDTLGLMQVSAAGGEPRSLTEPETSQHGWPVFVPDGSAVLYTARHGEGLESFDVGVLLLDTGEQQTLVQGTHGSVTSTGHLVFARAASLWAVPFDADRLSVSGEPAPMVEGVQVNSGGWAHYALADDGTLVYLPSTFEVAEGRTLVWRDRDGNAEPLHRHGLADSGREIVLAGEGHLRRLVHEYVEHYHRERNHQGRDNQLLERAPSPARLRPHILRRARLGGMLNFYDREAA